MSIDWSIWWMGKSVTGFLWQICHSALRVLADLRQQLHVDHPHPVPRDREPARADEATIR
ncbi:MAG: hypothetical protein HQ548_04100 [Chloroflexi bacterium]|nr:hypothetical protein [Chloroflexota bacterium]